MITLNEVGQGPRTYEFMRSENFDPCSWYGTQGHREASCTECQQRLRMPERPECPACSRPPIRKAVVMSRSIGEIYYHLVWWCIEDGKLSA